MKRFVFIALILAALAAPAHARRRWIPKISAASFGNITADLWSPMETASPDATTMKAAASGTANASSTWTANGSQVTSSSAQKAFLSTINSTASTGTYGYSGHHDTPNYIKIDLNAAYTTTQSVGFAYQVTTLGSGTYTVPAAWGEDGTTASAIVRFRVENNGGTYTAMLETNAGSSSTITISAATWYYVTVKIAVSAGTCSLSIYDSAGAQVGATRTIAGQNKNFYYHFFGCYASSSATGDDYVDNYILDKTSATFPLAP